MRNRHRMGEFARVGWLSAGVLLWGAGILAICASTARAQEEQEGIDQGNYNIKQSIEFGGRFVNVTGNTQVYDTFVNLQQGPRLLGFTTEMRSLDHHGTLFDTLYFSNFGYGGDPNDVSRLRIGKNRVYSFDALFRRDENFWNYSLQANPLNPTTPFANGPAGFGGTVCTGCVIANSPHLFNTRRNLQDYNLLLLPESKVRFRIGYSRNTNDGPSYSTIHQGTEQLLLQDYQTTVNTYRLGFDLRLLPRTNISYDQLWNFYKGDTSRSDNPSNPLFVLANGTPVDLGVSFNSAANQPCGGTFLAGGVVNPTCSAYIAYLQNMHARTNSPTEQISMQSSYWKNVDFSARASYTGGDAKVFGYDQNWTGREARTNLHNDLISGSVNGRRVLANTDFGATWHITEKLDFIDSFHYSNWHYPMEFDNSECSFFSAGLLTPARVFTPTNPVPVTCTAPTGGIPATPGAPITHSTSSAADITVAANSNFLKQDEKTNVAQLEYRFSSKVGARLGFRYRHRAIDDNFFTDVTEVYFPNNANRGDCAITAGVLNPGCTASGNGTFTFVTPNPTTNPGETLINEYAGLFGVWAQPTKSWRISFDTELMSADNTFTRISPRQSQEYRVRTKYRPVHWFSLNGSIRIWEARDNISEVDNLQHDRSYGFSVTLQPTEKLSVDLGYDYDDIFSQILICYISTTAPAGLEQCPGVAGLVQQLSTYTNTSHYGNFDIAWTPIHRFTAHLGANLTGTSGSAILLNPNAVPGPLNSKYLLPYGGFDYRFATHWTGRANWAYYGYHEDLTTLTQDIFAPRNFNANTVTLSVRYAF
jgi:hypothetical protein